MRPFVLVADDGAPLAQGVVFGDGAVALRWCAPGFARTELFANEAALVALGAGVDWLACIDPTNGYLAAFAVDRGDSAEVVSVAHGLAGGFVLDDEGDTATYAEAPEAMAAALAAAGWAQLLPAGAGAGR
jgi:hypothetical protein